jgi:hypothetical protein
MLVLFLTIRYAIKVDEKKKKSRIRKLSKKIRYKTNHDDIDIDFPDNFSYHNNSVYDGSIYPEYMLRDELIDNGNGNMLYKLQKEYEYNVENNDGSMSDQMMKDMYQTRTSKYLFDEMSRVISGK